MDDADEEQNTTFTKQRRNLLIISGILAIQQLAGINFSKTTTLTLMGVSALHIQNPQVIIETIWIIWIYWYIRYIQVFNTSKYGAVTGKYNTLLRRSIDRTIYSEIYNQDVDKTYAVSESYSNLNITPLKVTYEWPSSTASKLYSSTIKQGEIKTSKFLYMKLKAVLRLCLLEMDITENIFPFIFGMLPLLIKIT